MALEVPFSTVLAGVVIRGRMDAVFAVDDGFVVVDWKTGRPPRGASARAASTQLAAYRQAWAGLRNVPLEKVDAAFHYVAPNLTVWPRDLMNVDDLAAPLRTDKPNTVEP